MSQLLTGKGTVYAAWERFVQGEDQVEGIRPEVAISWHRCREQYRVNPHLTEAPVAVAEIDHALDHDVVFTELGGLAVTVAQEVECLNAVVTVTDATGRILAAWGDRATLTRASDSNLAPWYCWSECATGTNGMGTALETNGPALIRGSEHWCEAFHSWVCAGIAVRDVVTGEPIAALNISSWRTQLPGLTGGWLSQAVTRTHSTLKRRARDTGTALVAAFSQARARAKSGLAAVDTAGKVVIADDTLSVLMGVPALTPAVDPVARWESGLPDVVAVARYASRHAAHNPDWVGSTQIFTHLADEPTPINIRPVFVAGRLAGNLIFVGAPDGTDLPLTPAPTPRAAPLRRLLALRDSRTVLLRLPEVSFAKSDGNDIWLTTDQGCLRAATQGLDKLEADLAEAGFLRVHRRYVVNLDRVREFERRAGGEMFLVMDAPGHDLVPVSRRNAPAVRRALGL